jgi:hypothetical protein
MWWVQNYQCYACQDYFWVTWGQLNWTLEFGTLEKFFFDLASTDVNGWMKSNNYYQHKLYVRVYQQFSNSINPNIIFPISNPPTIASLLQSMQVDL